MENTAVDKPTQCGDGSGLKAQTTIIIIIYEGIFM
jgi:hypothetical protein